MLALIAAEQGKLRDGLYSLLVTCPQIDGISFIDNLEDLSGWVKINPKNLIVLYPSFPILTMLSSIQNIKRQDAASIVIAIVSERTEGEKALINGADGVLLKGFSSRQLFQLIGKLVDKRDDKNKLMRAAVRKVNFD